MICYHGGLTFICHNELTTSWLHEVCHNVAVEPYLQPLTGKALVPASTNCRSDAIGQISTPEATGVDDRVLF